MSTTGEAGKFMVMPEQFLPQALPMGSGAKKSSTSMPLVAGISVVILAIIGAIVYVLFFSGIEAPQVAIRPGPPQDATPTTQAPETIATTTPEAIETPGIVVSGSAYGVDGLLRGQLSITIPSGVASADAGKVGVTVLDQQDVQLPADATVIGGLYSVYPIGQQFSEGLSFEISAQYTASSTEAYPAYLRGTIWQEITNYEKTITGYAFTLDRIPSGYVALIEREEALPEETDITVPTITATVDTDADGLTDTEEALFGTDKNSPDTDADTYPDPEEITNGYSPIAAGEKLADGALFKTYTNPTYGYKAPYPTAWRADALDQTNKQVLFISDTDEFFEILVEENPENLPVVDWYRGLSPALATVQLSVSIVGGVPAVWSPTGKTLYSAKDGLVYVINYNNGAGDTVNWPFVFEYFYSHFEFGDTTTAATPPSAEL